MDINYKKRFLIIGVVPDKQSREETVQEFKETYELIQTLDNAVVVDMMEQKKTFHEHIMSTYIGAGKAEEVAEKIKFEKIDFIILNDIVKTRQKYNLQKIVRKSNKYIQIWDRVDLILQIFSKHANTAEAKLQIELAKMRYMGPRIYGMGYVLSQQAGGIGVRGIGETNVELMKRHWRDGIKEVQLKLHKLITIRKKQLERRKKLGLLTVSIIGYTNAGKTSLFNRLSGKEKLSENSLFATLDSSVGKMYITSLQKEVLLSDTIGFIRKLPFQLVDAFKSTLLESVNSDLLLHVIDISDPDIYEKIEVVEEIVNSLRIKSKRRIYIFNKIDACITIDFKGLKERFKENNPVFISVNKNIGIDILEKIIGEQLSEFIDF